MIKIKKFGSGTALGSSQAIIESGTLNLTQGSTF